MQGPFWAEVVIFFWSCDSKILVVFRWKCTKLLVAILKSTTKIPEKFSCDFPHKTSLAYCVLYLRNKMLHNIIFLLVKVSLNEWMKRRSFNGRWIWIVKVILITSVLMRLLKQMRLTRSNVSRVYHKKGWCIIICDINLWRIAGSST